MIKEIKVCVSGYIFSFRHSDYSQNTLEIMWQMLYEEICHEDKVLSLSPEDDILIRTTSIDFADKIIMEDNNND